MPDDTPPLDGGRPAEVTRPTVRKGTAMRVTIAFAWLPALLWAGLTATARGEEPAGAPPARKHSNLERLAPDRPAARPAQVEAAPPRRGRPRRGRAARPAAGRPPPAPRPVRLPVHPARPRRGLRPHRRHPPGDA